jgi:hypothetical protein
MYYKPNIDQVLERYRRFWSRSKTRVPFIVRIPDLEIPADKYFTDPEAYAGFYENMFSRRMDIRDDFIPSAVLELGAGFTVGLFGGEVSFGADTSWSDHPLDSWDRMDHIRWNFDCRWGKYFEELIKYFVRRGEGKYTVGLRNSGPLDFMANLRNPTLLCVDVFEEPDRFHDLAKCCGEAMKRHMARQFDLIPPVAGGYCDYFSMWMPGRSAFFTCDLSGVFSPAMYKEHLFQHDQEYVRSLDRTWVHVHSGGETHQVVNFLQLKNVLGIQIVNDSPAGPPLTELVPLFKRVQRTHCLILRKFPLDDLKPILKELSPLGLFLDLPSRTVDEAKKIADHWDDICFDIWKE